MDPKTIIRQILEAVYCGDIFEQNPDSIRTTYHEYAKTIHPDLCQEPVAAEAFARLSKFYSQALDELAKGTWHQSGRLWLDKNQSVAYRNEKPFELGTRYSGDGQIIWAFDQGKEKWADRFFQRAVRFPFLDSRMKGLYRNRIPDIEKAMTTGDGRQAVILKKDPGEYPMDLFLACYGRTLGGRDIAWMISRAVDLCCFLYVCGLTHNGISAETLYIDPEHHTLHLYGGWQYMVGLQEKMTGTTRDIYQLIPSNARTTGMATPVTDMECVRDLFQTIAKDIQTKAVPKDILEWINAGSKENPILEYERWNRALDKAYGKRKFQVFSAKADEIYSRH